MPVSVFVSYQYVLQGQGLSSGLQNVQARSCPSFNPNSFSHFLPSFLILLKSAVYTHTHTHTHTHIHTHPTSSSLQARCQIGFQMAQVIFPSVPGLNRLLQVVCEKKMTVLICFLEIKRLVWKPLIIKVDVAGGHGTRGQKQRPQAGQFLAWGHQLALEEVVCQCSPFSILPSQPPTQRLLLPQEGPASPCFPDSETELPLCRPHCPYSNFSLSFLNTPIFTISLDNFFLVCGKRGGMGD